MKNIQLRSEKNDTLYAQDITNMKQIRNSVAVHNYIVYPFDDNFIQSDTIDVYLALISAQLLIVDYLQKKCLESEEIIFDAGAGIKLTKSTHRTTIHIHTEQYREETRQSKERMKSLIDLTTKYDEDLQNEEEDLSNEES